MKNDNATVDDRAAEDPRNSLCGFDPEFERAATHGPSMRHSRVWPDQLHSPCMPDESGDDSRREGEDFRLDAVAEEGDGPGYGRNIADPLCMPKRTDGWKPKRG